MLDALEAKYPMLRGTIRDHVTQKRRPMVRFFACEEDISHDSPDAAAAPTPWRRVRNRFSFWARSPADRQDSTHEHGFVTSVLLSVQRANLCATMSQSFESSRAAEPVGAFPHAKRVGDLLFLSGIGPRMRGSKEIPGVTLDAERNIVSYDIEKQCHAVFENVRLVLEDAGASWNDIVDVSVFLTDMKKDFPIFNRIYPGVFRRRRQTQPDAHNGGSGRAAHTDRD